MPRVSSKKAGKVYITGAGPGDPALVTVKAVEILKSADVVVYDLLANDALLEYAPKGIELIYVGKNGGDESANQIEINKLLSKKARQGKTVLRLKGGDPFLFGRGAEECERLAADGIDFEVIPGVTSVVAVPAYAGISLTHRDYSSSVTVISGHRGAVLKRTDEEWSSLASASKTIVILMGRRNLKLIAEKLMNSGMSPDTPVALVRDGTTSAQQTITGPVKSIAALATKAKVETPVMIVIGDVVSLRDSINWFETRPLFAKRILVTRTLEQAGSFLKVLSDRGATPVSFPTIKITPPDSFKDLDRAIKRLESYDWIIFTSVNGVKHFFSRLKKLGLDVRELKGVMICAIGPMTARAVLEENITVDLTPKEFIAEAVISALSKEGIKGKKFLLPRATEAREVIPKEIKKHGGKIKVAYAYKTVAPRKRAREIKEEFLAGRIDVVTFTSSSTVTNFVNIIGKRNLTEMLKGVKIACIGPVTADTAKGFGIEVDIMPKTYTIDGLTAEMERYYSTDEAGKEI